MAFHHALSMLDAQARATLSYFMQTTFVLLDQQLIELYDRHEAARRNDRKRAKDLKLQCSNSASLLAELMLSKANEQAVNKFADDFLPEGEHKDFVEIVKSLSRWRYNPEVIKRLGRQTGILESYTNAAMTLCMERMASSALVNFDEEALLDYNYALCAVLASERHPEAIDEERMVDPTWHPLSVGRFALPIATNEKMVGTLCSLADDEALYLRTLFHDFKEKMAEGAHTVESVCEALAERYPGPFSECFRDVYAAFDKGLGADHASSRDLMVKLVETAKMPEIILRLRAQMIYMEPTTFPWPLTAPVKVLGLVMNFIVDPEGESLAAGMLTALLDTEVTKEEIYLHYKHPIYENDMFAEMVNNLPPEILAPTMLSVELLLPYLARVFTTEGMAELQQKSQGKLSEVCPIFQAEDRVLLTSQMGFGLAKAAFGFRKAHPTLMPALEDKAAVRAMLLKLPDCFSYIMEMPRPEADAASPADDYYGVLLLWLFATDSIPVLLEKGWLPAEDGDLETMNLLFRLLLEVLKKIKIHNQVTAPLDWKSRVGSRYATVEKSLDANEKAEKAKKARKAMEAGFLDDEVPEGTIFN